MWQTLITYLLVALAALWLVRHLFWPARSGNASGCASGGCDQCAGCPAPAPADPHQGTPALLRIPVRQQ